MLNKNARFNSKYSKYNTVLPKWNHDSPLKYVKHCIDINAEWVQDNKNLYSVKLTCNQYLPFRNYQTDIALQTWFAKFGLVLFCICRRIFEKLFY